MIYRLSGLFLSVLCLPYIAFAGQADSKTGTAPATTVESPKKTVTPTKPATEKKLPTLIVFNIVPERGVDKSLSNLITELIIDKITKAKKYNVMGQKDLEKMLSWEQNKQLQGCSDTGCLVQLAGAMGASYYIEGSIGVLGEQYLITLKLIDAEKVVIKDRSTEKVAKDEKIIAGAVEAIVDKITGPSQDSANLGATVGSARAERGPTVGPTLRDLAFAPVFAPGFGGIAVGGEW